MIPYIGGKNYLASWIIENFPTDYEQMHYCEVFGGGGWVLYKKKPSFIETYNDLNKDLVHLFKMIRDNYPEFSHRCQWSLHSREMYEEAIQQLKDDEFINKVDRAVKFAVKRTQSFSGGNNKSWGYSVASDKQYSGKWLPFLRRMEIINSRLKRVQIECRDFEDVIKRYDGKQTLFYLDPPYVGVEGYYKTSGVEFKTDDHQRLNRLLKKIKGKFVLSYYEHELVRKLYSGFRIISKQSSKHSCGITRRSSEKTKPKAVELLIMNY